MSDLRPPAPKKPRQYGCFAAYRNKRERRRATKKVQRVLDRCVPIEERHNVVWVHFKRHLRARYSQLRSTSIAWKWTEPTL